MKFARHLQTPFATCNRRLPEVQGRKLRAATLACILMGVAGAPALPQEAQPQLELTLDSQGKPPAQSDAKAPTPEDTDALRKAAQNPVASLISVPIQENWNFGIGPNDRTQNVLNIQPVIPLNMG